MSEFQKSAEMVLNVCALIFLLYKGLYLKQRHTRTQPVSHHLWRNNGIIYIFSASHSEASKFSAVISCLYALPPGHNGVWCFPITGMSCFIDGWTSGWRLPLPLLCSPCYYRNRCPCLPPFITLPHCNHPHQTNTHTDTHRHTHFICMEHKLRRIGRILGSFVAHKICWACGSLNSYIRVHFAPRHFAAGQMFGLFFHIRRLQEY